MTIEGESIMLPAKFARFASRVCCIAQKVFSVSDTDNANSVADASAGSDSTYSMRPDSDYHSAPIYSYSNMQVNSSSSSLSSSSSSSLSDNDSLSSYVGKTARKSHIFRNMILAIIVTFATIVTMLIVPPLKEANAASVWWDYAGNGYVAATTEDNKGRKDEEHTYDAADAFRDMRIEDPVIEKENGRTKVTYKIIFNRNAEFARQLDSGEMQPKGNKPKDGAAYLGRPILSLFLPKGLDKSSILVKRYWEGSSGKINIGETSAQLVREDQDDMRVGTLKTFGGKWSAWTYTKDPSDSGQLNGFNDSWNDNLGPSSGDNGVGGGLPNPYKYSRLQGKPEDCQYSMCEIKKWNDRNLFETMFASWEWTNDRRYTWIVTAYLANGYTEKDVYTKMPVAAGFRSNYRRNKYAVFGPFDTDGDGIPDYVEHLHNMNPKGVNDIDYPQYDDSMLKDYGKDNVPLTTYGRPVTVKPLIKTGKWEGDSSKGKFVYDGKTSTDLPDDIGIRYSIVNKSDNSIQTVNSPNNMPEGSVYINPNSGYITYNPRKSDKNKTFTFGTKITYPNPELYNCNNSKTLEYTNDMRVKVIPQSWIYNPVYETLENVEPTAKNAYTNPPTSAKDSKRKNNVIIQEGPLPRGTSFVLKKYTKKLGDSTIDISDNVLSWSKIENNDLNTGRVHFTPGKVDQGISKQTPVLVTYPDGSTSAEPDSANAGAPVYAKVTVKKIIAGQGDLHLAINKGNDNYSLSGIGVDSNRPLNLTINEKMKPNLILDSWSNVNQGKIVFRSICYEEKNNTTANHTFIKSSSDSFNGLHLGDPVQWERASEKQEALCTRDNLKCETNKYLYKKDYEKDTMERSRATISGTPISKGTFGCRVFAFHQGSQLLENFDKLAKDSPSLMKDYNSGDMASSLFRFTVYSLSHRYNPSYVPITARAGNFTNSTKVIDGKVYKNTTSSPTSQKNANNANKNQDDVKQGPLPDGTWFEFKKYKTGDNKLNWADWEPENQSNKPKSGNKGNDSSEGSGSRFGKVTFRPHKWMEDGDYNQPVIVHYPDGSTSEDPDSGNLGNPVYAKVHVVRETPRSGDLKLRVLGSNEYKKNKKIQDKLVDSWSTYKPGLIYQRMICYEKDAKTGKAKPNSYKLGEINGLTLVGPGNARSPKQWLHATDNALRKKCNKSNGSGCNISDYLYDYDVNANGNNETTERTNGYIKGTPKNYGDFVCKVYAIKDLVIKGKHGKLQDKFDGIVRKHLSSGNVFDQIKTVLNNKTNANNPELDTVNGIDWSVSTLNISVHPDSHYYNPKYETITLDAGTHGTSGAPQSTKNANEATYNQDDIKTGDLPAGTWFEIKKYKSENANIPLLTYALFENGQDNTDDKKNAKDKTQAGKFGKVAFYPHKWMPATTENNPDKVPVVVHYPDGSTSQDEDSGNNGKPIYASVNILRPWKLNGDLHLNVYKQYENGKFTGPVDDINGITVMKGIGLLKNMGIDSWSSHKIGGITLRLLCREGSATSNSSNSQQWSENLDKLFFKLDWQKAWDHASFQEQQECRKSGKAGDGCNPAGKYLLFDSTGNTTERASGTITSSKAPTQTGEYYCAVFALKPDALDTYKAAVGDDHKIDVINNDIAATINPTGNRDEDWAVKYFPVHVVEQFKLPKTGGEDCVNWNMLMSVLCVIGTGVMAAGFFLEQTKWGRAMLDTLLRKTLIKDFICKTAKKLRALRRRSERWRC
uniref:Rib/alpha-like domain-containing protein n=2 Tax=Gardnerella vaginalis TaxID=2702 RepID=UPI002155C8F8|nr:Rib/alpha-like domain-containing protein [Gardnerella vaginalis]